MGELKGAMTLNAVPSLFVLLTHPNPKQFVSVSACIFSYISYSNHTACEPDYLSSPAAVQRKHSSTFACELRLCICSQSPPHKG